MLILEFTVEPFTEGNPGPHVSAAVEAAEAAGGLVEFGPFGTTCTAAPDVMPQVIAALVEAAFGHGANVIAMQVSSPEGHE